MPRRKGALPKPLKTKAVRLSDDLATMLQFVALSERRPMVQVLETYLRPQIEQRYAEVLRDRALQLGILDNMTK